METDIELDLDNLERLMCSVHWAKCPWPPRNRELCNTSKWATDSGRFIVPLPRLSLLVSQGSKLCGDSSLLNLNDTMLVGPTIHPLFIALHWSDSSHYWRELNVSNQVEFRLSCPLSMKCIANYLGATFQCSSMDSVTHQKTLMSVWVIAMVNVRVSIVTSKTKVAPLKRLTPELCGAFLLSEFLHHVREVLSFQLTGWTDNTCADRSMPEQPTTGPSHWWRRRFTCAPGHFLIGRPLRVLPPIVLLPFFGDAIVQHFWNRWTYKRPVTKLALIAFGQLS